MVSAEYLQEHLGPIDFVVVEIPEGAQVAAGFQRILDLVDQHIIRVIDFEFISRSEDGSLGAITPVSIGERGGFDFSIFEGASSGILQGSDFDEVAASLQEGSIAGILVYEELALLPALAEFEAGGSVLIGEGSIDVQELAESMADD